MRRIPALLCATLGAAALAASGCDVRKGTSDQPSTQSYDPGPPSSSYSPPPPSEAGRAREMEAKQEEMNRKLEAARAGGMTPEEIERAYQEYERERLELNQMAESAAPPPADAPVDPPPPL